MLISLWQFDAGQYQHEIWNASISLIFWWQILEDPIKNFPAWWHTIQINVKIDKECLNTPDQEYSTEHFYDLIWPYASRSKISSMSRAILDCPIAEGIGFLVRWLTPRNKVHSCNNHVTNLISGVLVSATQLNAAQSGDHLSLSA